MAANRPAPSPRSRPGLTTAALLLGVLGGIGMVRHFLKDSGADSHSAAAASQTERARSQAARSPAPFSIASATAGETVPEEVREMRRRLREFIIPDSGVNNLPLPEALAKLQEHWQTLPHETSQVPPAEFILGDEAGRQVELRDNPPFVSLPVPSVSLLTNLQLLAAQADLKVEVTRDGAVLSPTDPGADKNNHPLQLALSGKTLEHFNAAGNSKPGLHFRTDEGIEVTVTLNTGDVMEMTAVDTAPSLFAEEENSSATPNGSENPAESSGAAVEATASDDGYTIDLNLKPEIIEFEGFINYGTPIQTTGINNSGQYEPVILTDSKILQPVFTTRIRQALARILGAMGVPDVEDFPQGIVEPFTNPADPNRPTVLRHCSSAISCLEIWDFNRAVENFEKARALASENSDFVDQMIRAETHIRQFLEVDLAHPRERSGNEGVRQLAALKNTFLIERDSPFGYIWEPAAGTLTAVGPWRTRRILTETAAAIQESARLGANLELSATAIDWVDGKPPPAPAGAKSAALPATANRPGFSSSSGSKTAAAPANPRLTVRNGAPPATTTMALPASGAFMFMPQPAKNVSASIKAAGAGFHVRVDFEIPKIVDLTSFPVSDLTPALEKAQEFIIPGSQWQRLDYRVSGSGAHGAKLSLFVKLARASLPDE